MSSKRKEDIDANSGSSGEEDVADQNEGRKEKRKAPPKALTMTEL